MERGVSPQARPTPQRSPQMHPTPPVPGMVLAPTTLASSIGAPGSSASASMRSRHGPKMLHRKSSKGSAVEHHSSQRLQDTFWELHRKLGERYTADMAILAHPGGHAHANSLQSNPLSDRGSAVSVSKLKESGDLEHSDRQLFAISDRLAASHASQLHASQISSMPKSSGQGFESESLEDKDLRQIRADGRKEEEPVDARGSPRVVLQEIPATPEQDTPHSVVPDAKGGQHPLQIDFRSRMSRSSEFSDDHVFVPRLCWINKSKSLGTRRKSRVSLTGDFSQSLPLTAVTQEAAKKRPWYWPRMIVLNPTGNFRSFWDFLGMLILLKDTIGIPLQLVDVDVSSIFPPWDGITKFSVIYWCFDIFFSFFTGYLDKGTLVSDFKSIAWHYLKTWFLIDLAVSLTDLLLEFGNFSSSIGESATATRFLRFLRLFRMLRLGKVSRVSAFLQDQFESEVASIQFSLALVMLAMILVEHVIACVWFGLGDDPGETWLTQNALKDGRDMCLVRCGTAGDDTQTLHGPGVTSVEKSFG
ncbi:Potassium voltage-gated channel subfamily H member 7 (Ether-a-go-go-related gene potassium channel 3) (ERG-3) (Eag-related protein 3) (Ether-a-go-go-related protein 3) (Voltage-gated potassium channel subunit Kv11.3), partial [Durusdinium trenchii]